MPSLPVVCDGVRLPVVDLVHIASLSHINPGQQAQDQSAWLREPLSHHFPAVRMMEFKYDTVRASDQPHSWTSIVEQAEDLLYNLRFRREEPEQLRRPILFVCHSFGGLLLKNALLISKRRPDFRDIFDSISGILFLACIHDEGKPDLEQNFLWCATVELGLTKTKKHDLLEKLDTPREWEVVKRIMEHFRMLYLPFPVRTFYETKATVYQSRPFRSDKLQILCPEETASLPFSQYMQKPADLDHAQLSAFPNRTEPFFGALLAELHELLDVHDVDESTDSSNIAQTISSLNSSLVNIEISSIAPSSRFVHSDAKKNVHLPCHILSPYQENPKFVGRQSVLDDIEAGLRPGGKIGDGQCVFAICGLGGMGKTQIAVQYAFNSLSKFKAILWVPADSREKILARYIAFAVELGLVETTNDDQNKAKDLVKEWFENADVPYLIIFDNADSVDNKRLLAEFWPTGKIGSILITSRDKSLLGEFPGQHLQKLLKTDAIELLMKLTNQARQETVPAHLEKQMSAAANLEKHASLEKQMKAAANLVKVVDYLPLAITQLASVAIEDCCSLSDLEASYHHFAQLIEDSEYGDTITGSLSQYPHSLSTVLNMNYERLDGDQQDLLNTLSFLDPDKIRSDLLTKSIGDTAQQQKVFQTPRRLFKARGFLLKSSLLYENTALELHWMHRLVQSTCQMRMLRTSNESRQRSFESAFNMVHKAFPVPPITGRHDRSYWTAQELCLAHVQMLGISVERSQESIPLEVEPAKFSKLLHDAAWYLYERGTFPPAYQLLDTAETVALRAKDRKGMLLILGEICRARASLQTETNQPQEAYESFSKELDYVHEAFDTGILKRPHMQEVFSLGGIANALQGLHRYADAEIYYRKALEAFKGMPGILAKMSILEHNFAICLWIQERPDEALEILDRIITDREDTTTYRTAHAIFALGNVQTSQGLRLIDDEQFDAGEVKLGEALATHRQALKLFRATVGDGHHKMGNTLYKIGCHLHRRRDYSGAITNLRDALDIFGRSDSFLNETARTTYMLGCVYQDVGEITNGRLLIEKAEQMRKTIVGGSKWSAAQGVADFDCLINCWSR